jgi:hypothetical protein
LRCVQLPCGASRRVASREECFTPLLGKRGRKPATLRAKTPDNRLAGLHGQIYHVDMARTTATSRPTATKTSAERLFTTMWAIAIIVTLAGITLAIVTWSWVPLVAIVFGLALPLIPLRTPLTMRQRGR